MFPKELYRFVKGVLDFFVRIFVAMAKRGRVDDTSANVASRELYKFRPFVYEKVEPDRKSKRPYPRSGHRIGADSANFYAFGGYNPLNSDDFNRDEDDVSWIESYPLFRELWKFNWARKEWTRYPNSDKLPFELASNALLLHRNFLMVYGGTGSPFGFRCSNQLFVCRVNEDKGLMEEIQTTGQLPLAAYGQALVYYNDYLYTIGGTTGILYTCDIHRLDMKTLAWEIVYVGTGKGDYEPTGRYRHEVGFDSKNIYVLGGGTAQDAFDFDEVPVFNLEKGMWYPQKTTRDGIKGIPLPRRCHGAVQVDNSSGSHIFITGGHDGQNVFGDLWRLNLKSFQWTLIETCQLPRPVYFHAAASSPEGRLFVFGGICSTETSIKRSNHVHAAWLCIPKLSEMCWEAVLHYSPHIVDCRSEDLIDIGLPRHFVQRLGTNSNK